MVFILKKGATLEEMEQIKKLFRSKYVAPSKKLDAKKFSGILRLHPDPVVIQKKLRDEWE